MLHRYDTHEECASSVVSKSIDNGAHFSTCHKRGESLCNLTYAELHIHAIDEIASRHGGFWTEMSHISRWFT